MDRICSVIRDSFLTEPLVHTSKHKISVKIDQELNKGEQSTEVDSSKFKRQVELKIKAFETDAEEACEIQLRIVDGDRDLAHKVFESIQNLFN